MSGFYLLHLRINGIKNISKEIQLDFYNKVITSFKPDSHRIKAIYGENGSGKTAIVTAVNIAKKIMLSPDYLRQTDTQSLLAELINKKNNEFFIEFEFAKTFDDKMDVYRYSLALAKKKNGFIYIKNENLDVIREYTRNKGYKNLFKTSEGRLISVNVEDDLLGRVQEVTQNVLEDRTFASIILDKNIKSKELVFDMLILVVFFFSINVYMDQEDMHEIFLMNQMLRSVRKGDKNKTFDSIGTIIDRQIFYLDSKGRDVVDKKDFAEYRKKIANLEKFLKVFKKDLLGIKIDKRNNGDSYICELVLDYGAYSVNREFESTGIKKLIRIYDALANADRGGISFIDEMDSNLNDVYLCKLIEYFKNYGKGQLCFTTHNLDPMLVLKDNKNSIDFLSSDNMLVSWKTTGNAAPDRFYRNGMIEHSPFNVDAIDFIGMFGE